MNVKALEKRIIGVFRFSFIEIGDGIEPFLK